MMYGTNSTRFPTILVGDRVESFDGGFVGTDFGVQYTVGIVNTGSPRSNDIGYVIAVAGQPVYSHWVENVRVIG